MEEEMKMVCKEVPHGSAEYEQTIVLRYEILREPLGLQFRQDELVAEKDSFHLTCWIDGKLSGCVVLTPLPGKIIRMRQFAVLSDFQGQGIGRALEGYLDGFVNQLGYREIVLNARESAVIFYEKLGYCKEGDRFFEVTLPHYIMRKCLMSC